MKCPNCHAGLPDGARFCMACGAALEAESTCAHCRHTNPGDARFCLQCGQPLASASTPSAMAPENISRPEGEHKNISVLFTDVVGYTSISERLEVEGVTDIIDGCFKLLNREVARCGGTVDKLLGDGLLVLFGAPVSQEDHAQRACRAALAMQSAVVTYAGEVRSRYGVDFQMRTGLNSGPVFVGTVGGGFKTEAMGDTVNLASRMCAAANPGGILAAGSTYALARDYFEFDSLGEIRVKGKEHAVAAYRLRGAKKTTSRFEASIAIGLSPFVGRDDELGALREAWAIAGAGRGRVIDIVGEPGVGKSRLLRQFRQSLKPCECILLEGQCRHQTNPVPYGPFIDVLRHFFGLEEADTEAVIKDKIEARARGLDVQFVSDLPFIYEMLSIRIEDNSYFKVEPEYRRNKLFLALARLLSTESARRPLIIVIEDLHWIDEASEELLAYLLQKLENSSVLILLTYRPEYSPSWKNRPGCFAIHLGELPAPQSDALLRSLLPDGEPAPELAELVLLKAGGNPLFVEEYTRALLAEGTIRKDLRYSLAASPSSIKLPDTLRGIIASRIDRLPGSLKSTLQVASVIGRNFGYDVLRIVLAEPHKLRNQLESLEELELIVERGASADTEYAFKHALIQDVAYGSLVAKTRRELHQKVATAIEKLYPDRLQEFLEVLAYHFRNGESSDKALDYAVRAGDKAGGAFSNEAAIKYYQDALLLCAGFMPWGDGIAAGLNEKLGKIYRMIGKFEQAAACYESSYHVREKYQEAVSRLPAEPMSAGKVLESHLPPLKSHQALLADLYHKKIATCHNRGLDHEALKMEDEGLSLQEISDLERARLLSDKALSLMCICDNEAAIQWAQKALEYATRTGDDSYIGQAYYSQGLAYRELGKEACAIESFKQELIVVARLSDLKEESGALNSMGACYSVTGDWAAAENCFARALEISRKIGAVDRMASTAVNMSDLLLKQNRVEQAIACLTEAFELGETSLSKDLMAIFHINLCEAYIKIRQWQKAEANVSLAFKELEQVPCDYYLLYCYHDLAEVHLGLGNREDALQHCRKGLKMAEAMKNQEVMGQDHLLLGRILVGAGEWDSAENEMQESLKIFEAMGDRYQTALALQQLASLYNSMREAKFRDIPPEIPRQLEQRASETFARLGVR